MAGPKRPHDHVPLADMKKDWHACLENKVGFKGYGISSQDREKTVAFNYDGKSYTLKQGSVVIAAITSCTNTSNPNVLIAAGNGNFVESSNVQRYFGTKGSSKGTCC